MTAHARAIILVVDDEDSNVLLLERMLARAGYGAITTTTDSRQVRTLAETLSPDIVLLDLMMPHKDGYEVMAEASGDEGRGRVPTHSRIDGGHDEAST